MLCSVLSFVKQIRSIDYKILPPDTASTWRTLPQLQTLFSVP